MADIPAQLLVQLYSKIATALSVHGTVGNDPAAILSLQIPGLYIQPNLDIHDPLTQYYVSNALNSTLACGWTVMPQVATVSDVYKSILDGKETPIIKLTPDQAKALKEAKKLLFDSKGDPSEAYRAYTDYQSNYFLALDNYEDARATAKNGGAPIPEKLKEALTESREAWAHEGHRKNIDRAIATVAEYDAYEPLLYWQRLSEKFSQYTRIAGVSNEYQYVTSNPPYGQWFQEFGWSDFMFDQKDYENQNPSGGAGVGDRCCCCNCPITIDVNFPNVPSTSTEFETELSASLMSTDFHLTARLRRIDIIRPWMDTNVFYSRAWRWSPASVAYGVVVSTGGDIAGRIVPTGVMPVLPTIAILARDVEIDWHDEGQTARKVMGHVESQRPIHFGPFQLSRAQLTDDHHISMPDPQLIGFISTLLPRCPNPEPTLPWPLTMTKYDGDWPIPVRRAPHL